MNSTSSEASEREDSNAVAVLAWGLKHFAWLLVIGGLACALAVPFYRYSQPPKYDATALVVAARLSASITTLPRYGTSVFDNGAVAAEVAGKFGAAGDLEDVVPKEASLVAAQDSIVMEVQGHSGDKEDAVNIANLAAKTFVDELNQAGPGVGVFQLQSTATAPVEATEPFKAAPYSVIVGTLGGLILATGLVLLILVLRRPVIAGPRRLGGLPVAGLVVLPRSDDGASLTPGMTTVARYILRRSPDIIYVLGTRPKDKRTATVARELRTSLGRARMRGRRPRRSDGEALAPSQVIELDTPDAPEFFEMSSSTLVVVVVREGTSHSELRRTIMGFDESQAALVMVRTSIRKRQKKTDDVNEVHPPSAPPMQSASPGLAKAEIKD